MKFLILTGLQSDYFTGSLKTPQNRTILPRLLSKIEEAKANGACVFVTVNNSPPHSPLLEPSALSALRQMDRCRLSVIHQATYGGVHLPPAIWQQAQRFGMPDEIELAGIRTGQAVHSNAVLIKAEFYQRKITVDAAACACFTPQTHKTALNAMRLCGIEIKNEGNEPWKNLSPN